MSNFRLLIYIFNLIIIIFCQPDNDSMTKALACMSVISQKYKGQDPDPSIYSTIMLKCFITLSDSKAKKILVGIESGQNVLSKKEIDKLTDYESLKDMSNNEIKRKSYELEKALKDFKRLQEEITGETGDIDPADYDDEYDDYDDDNFNRETPSNVHFFGLIPKGLIGIFNVFNSYLSLFFVFVVVYFGLLLLRKINDSENKMKKKKKIIKIVEEEYEEEEEFEPQNNDEKTKKSLKKGKKIE